MKQYYCLTLSLKYHTTIENAHDISKHILSIRSKEIRTNMDKMSFLLKRRLKSNVLNKTFFSVLLDINAETCQRQMMHRPIELTF
jgi:hypothetical protein